MMDGGKNRSEQSDSRPYDSSLIFLRMMVVGVLLCVSGPALATLTTGKARCGLVFERSLLPADFLIILTDKDYKELPPKYGYPKLERGTYDTISRTYTLHTNTPCKDDVYDVHNKTILRAPRARPFVSTAPIRGVTSPNTEAKNPLQTDDIDVFSDLSLEAVFIDESKYQLVNIFSAIDGHVGLGFAVRIPDLYLLDANGLLVPDGILYGVVDFNTYLHAVPSFEFGDTYTILDGTTASLAGMIFSTTPFTFDELNGFKGTPFSGTAVAISEHEITAMPEPSAFALVTFGLGALAASRRRKK
jgi:hypothetical protein